MHLFRLILLIMVFVSHFLLGQEIALLYWKPETSDNFGDVLSKIIVEKITQKSTRRCLSGEKRLLAIGSIIQFAEEGDILWGTGIGGRDLQGPFKFKDLDVRAVRGPLTRQFLLQKGIACPEIYGDPALLFPYLFPSFKKTENPLYEYIIIPFIGEMHHFQNMSNVIMPTEPWEKIINTILNSKLVISGSLHGLIIAEAFGIPARLFKINLKDRPFKYEDYYLGTGRPNCRYAHSLEEALQMGGETPPVFDPQKLIEAFPYDFISLLARRPFPSGSGN